MSLRLRDIAEIVKNRHLQERVVEYISPTFFYRLRDIAGIRIDVPLITALVERWRQETHTFHLPCGEATVTLQDVAVLLGLPIEGPPIITRRQKKEERDMWCQRMWGTTSPEKWCKANSLVSLKFFEIAVQDSDLVNGTENEVRAYAIAWMLAMVGAVLFPDKSSGSVRTTYLPFLEDINAVNTYSWGSSVLCLLYRELCNATHSETSSIAGPLILLQLWAWERLLHIRPDAGVYVKCIKDSNGNFPPQEERPPLGIRWTPKLEYKTTPAHVLTYYRDQLDLMHDYDMRWQPYGQHILELLPSICTSGRMLWTVTVPLIHNIVVEWHLPYRVLRQFGGVQEVPGFFDTSLDLHSQRQTDTEDKEWKKDIEEFVGYWNNALNQVPSFTISSAPPECGSGYMEWYNSITCRLIGRPTRDARQKKGPKPVAGIIKKMARALGNIKKMLSPNRHSHPLIESAYQEASQALEEHEEWGDGDPEMPPEFNVRDVDEHIPKYVRGKRSRLDKGKGKAIATSKDVAEDSDREDTDSDGNNEGRMPFFSQSDSSGQTGISSSIPVERRASFSHPASARQIGTSFSHPQQGRASFSHPQSGGQIGTYSTMEPLARNLAPLFDDLNTYFPQPAEGNVWLSGHIETTPRNEQNPYGEGFQNYSHITPPFQNVPSMEFPHSTHPVSTPAPVVRRNPNRDKKGKNRCKTGTHYDKTHK